MPTALQQAHSALLLKAVLVKGLKEFAPLYSSVQRCASDIEENIDDIRASAVVPVWGFLKEAKRLAKLLEKKSGKSLDTIPIKNDSAHLDEKQTARRLSGSLRDLSDWAENLSQTIKGMDSILAERLAVFRNSAFEVASGLEDLLLPEDREPEEDPLLIEYWRLAGIPLTEDKKPKSKK